MIKTAAIVLLLILLKHMTFIGQVSEGFDLRVKNHAQQLIAIPRPTILNSVEFKSNRIGLDLGYGQQWNFPFSDGPDTLRVKNFGNRYRVELRYYLSLNARRGWQSPYLSLSYCKIYQRYNLTTDWFSGSKIVPAFGLIDRVHVFQFHGGVCNYFKDFVVEVDLGVGLRIRNDQSLDAGGRLLKEYTFYLPNPSFALRIGYVFLN